MPILKIMTMLRAFERFFCLFLLLVLILGSVTTTEARRRTRSSSASASRTRLTSRSSPFTSRTSSAAVAAASTTTHRRNVRASVRSEAQIQSERAAQITDFRVAPQDEDGIFKYAFKTSNGIDVQAAGSPLETIGIYSYVSPEGIPIEVRYIADELGFHVVGRHLPRPPPIPDYILRSLEYIRTHTEDGKLKKL